MSIDELRLDALIPYVLQIPFKRAFTHASASRAETSSVWVEAVAGGRVVGQGESCPRPYVTNETATTAIEFIRQRGDGLRRTVATMAGLKGWVHAHREEIDRHPAAWCAIELAVLDAHARHHRTTPEALIGLTPLIGTFRYTAVVGDDDPDQCHALVGRYAALGFRDFKVKLSGDVERDRQKLSAFDPFREQVRVRVDANNVWTSVDEAVSALRRLAFDFVAIEEPLPANQYTALAALGSALGCPIVLDESLTRAEQLTALPGPSSRWIANVRISKMGGLLRSIDLIERARRSGIGVIVGAQVGETSLLTRAGLTAAHAAGQALVAQEGAFGTHLLAEDVCDVPLMFGAGGIIDVAMTPVLREPGLTQGAPRREWLRSTA